MIGRLPVDRPNVEETPAVVVPLPPAATAKTVDTTPEVQKMQDRLVLLQKLQDTNFSKMTKLREEHAAEIAATKDRHGDDLEKFDQEVKSLTVKLTQALADKQTHLSQLQKANTCTATEVDKITRDLKSDHAAEVKALNDKIKTFRDEMQKDVEKLNRPTVHVTFESEFGTISAALIEFKDKIWPERDIAQINNGIEAIRRDRVLNTTGANNSSILGKIATLIIDLQLYVLQDQQKPVTPRVAQLKPEAIEEMQTGIAQATANVLQYEERFKLMKTSVVELIKYIGSLDMPTKHNPIIRFSVLNKDILTHYRLPHGTDAKADESPKTEEPVADESPMESPQISRKKKKRQEKAEVDEPG